LAVMLSFHGAPDATPHRHSVGADRRLPIKFLMEESGAALLRQATRK